MSSNPLYELRKVGTFVQLTGLPGRPVRQPVFAGCTWRLCDRWLWLVTKSALEEYVVHDDALYKLTTFTFTFTVGVPGSTETVHLGVVGVKCLMLQLGLYQKVDFTIQPNKNKLLYYSAKHEQNTNMTQVQNIVQCPGFITNAHTVKNI